MTGDITFTSIGSWPAASGETYPISSNGLSWSGSSDGVRIFYRVDASNSGNLIIQTTDDGNEKVIFRTTTANGDFFQINSNDRVIAPINNETGSIGTSSYKWANIYSTNLYGKLTTTRITQPAISGTGTTASDAGASNADTRYRPAVWTFNAGITPTDGDVVNIKQPCAGHDYGTWLTLDNGTTYYPVVYGSSSRVTTHFVNGQAIKLYFDPVGTANVFARGGSAARSTVTGVWRIMTMYDSNSNDTGYYHRRIYPNLKAGTGGIDKYVIIMQLPDGRWSGIVPSSQTTSGSTVTPKATGKTASTNSFLLGHILVMYANAVYAENANVGTYNIWSAHTGLIDARYSFNLENATNKGFVGYKPVYIVGTVTNGLFTLDSTKWWTQTLPSSEDNKVYIYIGDAYDWYRMTFTEDKPIYWYKNGGIQLYSGTSEYALSVPLSGISNADDLKAIEALSGTSGLLKKTAANTWTLDTNSYVTKVSTGAGLTGGDITSTGTVKANLTSETKLTNAAADGTETSGRVYPVRLDKNGKLAVNVPWTNVNSSYLKTDGTNNMTADVNIITGDTDKFVNFWYNAEKKAGASWRTGMLGSGSADTNYYVIESGTNTTTATTWNRVLQIGQNTYNAGFAGNIYPLTSNSKTLGTTSYRWKELHIQAQTAGYSNGIIFTSGDGTGTKQGSMNADTNGIMCIYGKSKAVMRAQFDATTGLEVTTTDIHPTDSMTLGTSSNKWSTAYATTLDATTLKLHQGSAADPSLSGNARIEFDYTSGQPVVISYTPNDGYRAPAGLKVMGGASATPAWFEVEGPIYSMGGSASGKGYRVPHTGNTDGSIGGTTTPVYVDAGQIKAGTALKDLAYIAKPSSNTTTTYLRGDGSWVSLSDMGLSTAMHFIGVAANAITDGGTQDPGISGYSTKTAGDVIIDSGSSREYVWSTTGKWELLGGDSSYKTLQDAVNDPTAATTTSTTFIDTISQNTNGVITATKKTLPTASSSVAGITKVGASGGAAAYSHGTHVTTATVQEALSINTSSGSATKALTEKGTFVTFGTSNLTIGTTSSTAMAGNTVVTNVAISANTTTNANYPIVFATSNKDTTAAKNEGLQKSGAKFYFNPSTGNVQATTFNGYTLAAASAKAVVTSIDTSASLPTSNAVKTFVEGKGYVTSSGVTSITLKAGAGITLDTDNTAITSTGTRTISINGINTTSGSETTCLTAKGTWKTFGTSNLTIGTTSSTAMAGNTTVTNVAISADTTTNKDYAVVFGTTPSDGTSPTAAKTEGLQKNIGKFYFNPSSGSLNATSFCVDEHVNLKWNSTDSALEFVFA